MCKPCIKCGASDRAPKGKCRPCTAAYAAAYKLANAAAIKIKRIANYSVHKISVKKWQTDNADRVRANGAAYRAANREKCRAACRATYAKKSIDERAKARTATYEASKEKELEASKLWRLNNKELRYIYKQNRRFKENGGKLSKNIRSVLFDRQKGLCACCGVPLGESYHLDHIMPFALGGTNTDDNVQLLTGSCNRRKSAMHPDEYMRRKRNRGNMP